MPPSTRQMKSIELDTIAAGCPDYEAITAAQNFGISFLGDLKPMTNPRCDWCVNWQGGSCGLYQERADQS